MSKVYINGRSVIHKGDGQVNTCAVPDVCKTPSPGGPVPIPYVNVARDGDLAAGSNSVSLEGNPIALKESNLSTSSGDEPGTAGGGLISSKTKGKMTWASASIDVKIEGKGVIRFMEVTQHNGNTFNSAFIQQGGTGWAYGDDASPDTDCVRCKKPKKMHRILETPETKATAQTLAAELMKLYEHPTDPNEVLKPPGGKNGPRRPYMIGVLICKCGKGKYAAMSGEPNPKRIEARKKQFGESLGDDGSMTNGFFTAARKLGFKTCDAVNFNSILDSGGRVERSLLTRQQTSIPLGRPGFNKPGACAAQKLIQQAQRDGHRPALMTEQWFNPHGKKKVKITYRRLDQRRRDKDATITKSFGNGETVPSCDTCKKLITPMMCGNKKHPCAG